MGRRRPRALRPDAVADLLDRFLAVEEKFVGRADEDAATRELIKASSKKDAADVLLAHGKLRGASAPAGVSCSRSQSKRCLAELPMKNVLG